MPAPLSLLAYLWSIQAHNRSDNHTNSIYDVLNEFSDFIQSLVKCFNNGSTHPSTHLLTSIFSGELPSPHIPSSYSLYAKPTSSTSLLITMPSNSFSEGEGREDRRMER